MIENLTYVIMGFAATYLSLEAAWHHFTACRIKEMKMVLMTSPQAGPGRVL
jgi:hypothetical protein